MKFLRAHWQHLLFANYIVEPSLLEPYRPRGVLIDQFEGRCYVSLVAFLFNHTRILGFPIPFHTCFEEVNLRFYVYPEGKPEQRSVTFVKEIVPKRAIPLIANTFFGERYYVEPMWHSFDDQSFDYQWGKGRRYRFLARNIPPLAAPANGSLTEFITEHYWGYSKMNDKTIEYQVEHVPWSCAEVRDFEVKMDFAAHYGESFKVLDSADPVNVLYAQGSPVSVSFPSTYRLAADKSG